MKNIGSSTGGEDTTHFEPDSTHQVNDPTQFEPEPMELDSTQVNDPTQFEPEPAEPEVDQDPPTTI